MNKKNRTYDMVGFSNGKRNSVGFVLTAIGAVSTIAGVIIGHMSDKWYGMSEPVALKDLDDVGVFLNRK